MRGAFLGARIDSFGLLHENRCLLMAKFYTAAARYALIDSSFESVNDVALSYILCKAFNRVAFKALCIVCGKP